MAGQLIASMLLVALAAPAFGAQSRLNSAMQAGTQSLEAAWSAQLDPKAVKYVSPIKRVIGLLQKMKAELSSDADSDSEMYDKMVCWCETNDKEKTEAIKKAEILDADLSAEIEARSAKYGEQATEIERMKEEIASNTEALKKATAVREKEAGEFKADEKDMTQNIVNLKNAIEVLSKHNAASFAQMDAPVLSSLRSVLHDLAFKREMMLAGRSEKRAEPVLLSMNVDSYNKNELGSQVRSLLSALDTSGTAANMLPIEFAQQVLAGSAGRARGPGAAFLQTVERQPDTFESYSSRSGPIFGILTQMLQEFEENLSYEQKQEMQSAKAFKELAAAKAEQISSGKAKLDELEESHAANSKALSDAKEELQDTRDTRSADVEFLRNLKVTCQDLDRQFEDRTKTRSLELAAVSEAIDILTEDDASELMRKTVSLLQEGSETRLLRARRQKAAASLRKAAKEPAFDDLMEAWKGRNGESRASPLRGMRARMDLSTLSLSVSLDSFKEVKAMMDTMVADLKAEQEEEVKFKADCIADFDTTEKQLYEKSQDKESLEIKIETLAKEIEKTSGQIAEAKEAIASAEVEIKKASEAREKENALFQTSVADQRATQAVLNKALLRLKEFYKKEKGGAAFAQSSKQEPPVKFQAYGNNKGASPVIGLIEQIIEDSKATEAEDFKAEREAQADYETLLKDLNDIIAKQTTSIEAMTKANAESTETSESAKSDLESTEGEIGSLKKYEAEKHNECDWVLKNFQTRQKARLAEIEAIQSAKAILSGAK
mmetsp:Transcript_49409/g.92398  ORF Transcript_49409/g.92398 Transcript_49409/m.92398 type:complete len:776 (-) Transcript_49409:105-2432(-)